MQPAQIDISGAQAYMKDIESAQAVEEGKQGSRPQTASDLVKAIDEEKNQIAVTLNTNERAGDETM